MVGYFTCTEEIRVRFPTGPLILGGVQRKNKMNEQQTEIKHEVTFLALPPMSDELASSKTQANNRITLGEQRYEITEVWTGSDINLRHSNLERAYEELTRNPLSPGQSRTFTN